MVVEISRNSVVERTFISWIQENNNQVLPKISMKLQEDACCGIDFDESLHEEFLKTKWLHEQSNLAEFRGDWVHNSKLFLFHVCKHNRNLNLRRVNRWLFKMFKIKGIDNFIKDFLSKLSVHMKVSFFKRRFLL